MEEELERILKPVQTVRKTFPDMMISIDTYRAKVAKEAVYAGADIINDISGGSMDADMFKTVAGLKVPYILTHIQGTPQTMQLAPAYHNVVAEVKDWLSGRLEKLRSMGVKEVIIDPGFGFGKTVEHNFRLLKNLEELAKTGAPVLAGLSRKSMINKLLNINSKDSIIGTSVLNQIALQNGARILRVHDVKEAKEVVKLDQYIKGL
jgi:dihydropteroate synthase